MIAAALLATAQVAAAAPPKTSLFLRCSVKALGEDKLHEFNLVYFSEPPAGAQKLNLRDPDGLLPTGGRPFIADAWPTAILVNYAAPDNPRSRLAAILMEPVWLSAGKATLALDRVSPPEGSPSRYSGDCTYTEGDVAEREFQEINK